MKKVILVDDEPFIIDMLMALIDWNDIGLKCAGIANNGNQFMVSTSATEAPDFANGLFLTAANLGTALGAAICGMFITVWGTQSSPLGAVAFLLVGVASIIIRNSLMSRNKHIMAVTI